MNAYDEITARIIERLEEGVLPWALPYVGLKGARNLITQKEYSICNQMLLPFPGEYLTPKQAIELGGEFKGEETHRVYFTKMVDKKTDEKDEDGNPIKVKIPVFKAYNVLHVSQVKGAEKRSRVEPPASGAEVAPVDEAERIAQAYLRGAGVRLVTTPYGAEYEDGAVKMPFPSQYKSTEAYYGDLFRLLVRSTAGALSRSDEKPAREELVAEMASAMLMNDLEMDTLEVFDRSVAAIARWKGILSADTHAIVWAGKRAKDAVEYILSFAKAAEASKAA